MNKAERHEQLCEKIHVTYVKKNHDYGDAFGKSIAEHGLIAAIVRMEDKFNRFKTLAKTDEIRVKDEAIQDTLLDLANYCLMTVVEIEAQKPEIEAQKPEEKPIFCIDKETIQKDMMDKFLAMVKSKYSVGTTATPFNFRILNGADRLPKRAVLNVRLHMEGSDACTDDIYLVTTYLDGHEPGGISTEYVGIANDVNLNATSYYN